MLSILLFVSFLYHVSGETIVDEAECRYRSIVCPREGDASYAKYCCASGDGYLTCCNPYLSIGLGVSIPLVIITLLVAVIILVVCILIKCRSPKYYPSSVAYSYRRVREEREAATRDAPPSYSSSQGPPPAYTEAEVRIQDGRTAPQSGLGSPPPPAEVLAEARNNTQ